MAKITIEIEDSDNGSVRVVMTPKFAHLAMLINNGRDMTAAEGYALAAINRLRDMSKQMASEQPASDLVKGLFT